MFKVFAKFYPYCPLFLNSKRFEIPHSQKRQAPDLTLYSHCKFQTCRKYKFETFDVYNENENVLVKIKPLSEFKHDDNFHRRHVTKEERKNMSHKLQIKNATQVSNEQ
ncbi:UNVERIFIED_CONTAM: hypothetical protein RMT77_011502 [Armadillidium vulgare]